MSRTHIALSALVMLGAIDVSVAGELQPRKNMPVLDRRNFTAQEEASAQVPGFQGVRFDADSLPNYRKALPTQPGPWLALSAGGEDGAFGAGVISGWSRSDRPSFALVTGVSTGALIGTFAFLGPDYDSVLRAAYTSITAADVFELGGTRESLVDAWPLKRLIEKNVTPKLLQDVADAHASGRRLFVVTTNLDSGKPIVWNMGAIAAHGGPEALALFRKVLLASSSIPGVFQPTLIDVQSKGSKFQELHADGSLASPFYIGPEALLQSGAADLPITDLYVVVNGKLSADFSMTQREVLPILGRAFAVALRSGERIAISAYNRWAKARGLDLKVAAIPSGFSAPSKGSFDPDYMSALFERGQTAGAQQTAFSAAVQAPSDRADNTPVTGSIPR